MNAAVLVVGDANPDLLLRGDVVPRFGQAEQLLDGLDVTLGGSAAIVACGLAALGTPVLLAARVGDDVFGRIVLDALGERGVDTTHVTVDPAVPTGCSVILDRGGDRSILTLPGTIPTLRADDVTDALLQQVAHVHVASYFLQPQLAVQLPGLLARARAAGCTTSLDTNWDPAGSWAGVSEVLPLVDVFLPNLAELLALTAATADGDEGRARALHALGPVVAVKAGADGAWAVTADGVVRAPGLAVDVVDTVGAGDSFDAGFLAAFVRRLPVAECLRWAAAAGSLSTRAAGGTPAQPRLPELRAALA
jgi:sugar/nucleoside kinase (ribokinase family)